MVETAIEPAERNGKAPNADRRRLLRHRTGTGAVVSRHCR